MEINYEAPDPPHRQIAAWLVKRINSGEFDGGRRLPSEQDIMGETGVARSTSRRAIKYLRDQGVIVTVPGRGSYPAER